MTDLPRAEVARRLDAAEREHDVRILYACESGSRAWGFASPDSDVDVRFLYVHRPEWYLSIRTGRDVIEQPIVDPIDLSGWDLRKALGLLYKSNPPLLEWLRSPLVYRERASVSDGLRALVAATYSERATMHHYLSMARRTVRGYLQDESVRYKKYFYALRPLLAGLWIERERTAPPMEFGELAARGLPDGAVRDEVDALLARKRASGEAETGPHLPAIDAFIHESIERLDAVARTLPKTHADIAPLDAFFRATLREVWS